MNKIQLIKPSPAEDAAIAVGIVADPDTMELNDEQFAEAAIAKRGRGRPVGSVADMRKQSVTMRLDPDVVEAMRATGDGWQTRVNDLLRQAYVQGRQGGSRTPLRRA